MLRMSDAAGVGDHYQLDAREALTGESQDAAEDAQDDDDLDNNADEDEDLIQFNLKDGA